MPHNHLKNILRAVSIAASILVLAGCGGGGGDGGTDTGTPAAAATPPAAPAAPATPASVAPATSVPASTYASADQRANLFTLLNNLRVQMGVGALRQDTVMDVAAQAHADYINTNGTLGGHQEDSSKPGFYGQWPRDRATKAGVPATTWVGETISGTGTADSCLSVWSDSVYHLQAITANQETVGLGFNTYCVADFGTITGQPGPQGTYNTIPTGGGQQPAANAIAYYPFDGTTVNRYMDAGETPRPAPDIARPGHPLMVRVRADGQSDVLSVSTFTLIDSTGANVPGRILIAPNAQTASNAASVTDTGLNPGVAFFLPLAPLGSNATYTATFSGARNGTPISKTWSFKTYY